MASQTLQNSTDLNHTFGDEWCAILSNCIAASIMQMRSGVAGRHSDGAERPMQETKEEKCGQF